MIVLLTTKLNLSVYGVLLSNNTKFITAIRCIPPLKVLFCCRVYFLPSFLPVHSTNNNIVATVTMVMFYCLYM